MPNDPKEEERWKPRKLEQTRNYDIPPPEDSDGWLKQYEWCYLLNIIGYSINNSLIVAYEVAGNI